MLLLPSATVWRDRLERLNTFSWVPETGPLGPTADRESRSAFCRLRRERVVAATDCLFCARPFPQDREYISRWDSWHPSDLAAAYGRCSRFLYESTPGNRVWAFRPRISISLVAAATAWRARRAVRNTLRSPRSPSCPLKRKVYRVICVFVRRGAQSLFDISALITLKNASTRSNTFIFR